MSDARPPRATRTDRGFSFIEILVVMGIIAVLAGIAIVVMQIAVKKTPQIKTHALVTKISGTIDMFYAQFRAYPPGNLAKLGLVTGFPLKIGKAPNETNSGIESFYLAAHLPGFDHTPELSDAELCNTDRDALDKPVLSSGVATLFEIRDAWGNPLIYFAAADYVEAEKSGATYVKGTGPESDEAGDAVSAKPWRLASGGFAQPGRYQLFSMGPDGEPNTMDDVKAWEP